MQNVRKWVKELPERKKYIDFISATLSLPIVFTVMLTNLSNFNHRNDTNAAAAQKQTPAPTVAEVVKVVPIEIKDSKSAEPSPTPSTSTSPTPTAAVSTTPMAVFATTQNSGSCNKQIGPVTINSPKPNEVIDSTPLFIDVSNGNGYCAIQWKYRIDGGAWSEYMNKGTYVNDLTTGAKTLEVQVKSTVSDDVVMLNRSFSYKNSVETTDPSPTTAPTVTAPATGSAALNASQTPSEQVVH